MPRPLRIEFDGAWYHVMNRGTNRSKIFLKTQHYLNFLSLLENITLRFKVEIHAYCLMSNHYHLLIRTPIANLSKAMRYLDGVYTQRFNRFEDRDGPLFRGRYKAILIDKDNYLLQVSRYIHRNPVEAGICSHVIDYRWSSYHHYDNEYNDLSWLVTSMIPSFFNKPDWRIQYRNYVNEGIDQATKTFYHKSHIPTILGDASFIKKHLYKIPNTIRSEFSTDINFTEPYSNLAQLVEAVSTYYQVNKISLSQPSKGIRYIPRLLAVYLSHLLLPLTHKEIATFFCMQRRSISSTVIRMEKLIEKNSALLNDVENIINCVNDKLARK